MTIILKLTTNIITTINLRQKATKILKSIGALSVGVFIVLSSSCILETFTIPNTALAKDINIGKATVKSAGGKYVGPLNNEYYEGEGQFSYLKDGIYTGNFSASKRSGNGTFKWKNGDIYVGTWVNDNMDTGTYTFKDGRSYKGKFVNNKIFKGHVELGAAAANFGFLSFAADINDGKLHAIVYKKSDGSTYNGFLTGYAEIRYATGNTYVGNVVNGVRSGSGTFRWMTNNYQTTIAYYTGEWADDDMNGTGTYFYSSATYPNITGKFTNGNLNGYATYNKDASTSFTTSWKNGLCVNNNV